MIHVSLGTNDDPRAVGAFRAAIREVMDVAGPRRCVVWTNIVRPPVGGAGYAGYNRALARESRPRDNLRVVNWARMVHQRPGWLREDRLLPIESHRHRGGHCGPLPCLFDHRVHGLDELLAPLLGQLRNARRITCPSLFGVNPRSDFSIAFSIAGIVPRSQGWIISIRASGAETPAS